MDVYLGLDTSCYTTSAALCTADGGVLASARKLLPVALGQRGLRQSEAVFVHIRQLPDVLAQAFAQAHDALGADEPLALRAVAASKTPTDDPDSYMPVFLTGWGSAQAIATAQGVPCHAVCHQAGHIAAGRIGNDALGERFLAVHLSGGTTDLLDCDGGRITRLGGSMDVHAGQLIDRLGVRLGLPFPAGPEMEKLASACKESPTGILPVSLEPDGLRCHLSGAEAQAVRLMDKLAPPRLALETYDLLARTLLRLLKAGQQRTQARQALIVGGVASSLLLRGLLAQRLQKARVPIQVFFGEPRYSADNAAGVARLCWQTETKRTEVL